MGTTIPQRLRAPPRLFPPLRAADETASTLLHHAARGGRADLAAALIARKAAVNVVNKFGLTPLAEAEVAGHDEVAAALRAAGGARSSKLHASFYALHAAVMEQDAAEVARLLAEGSDPNQEDYFQVRSQLSAPASVCRGWRGTACQGDGAWCATVPGLPPNCPVPPLPRSARPAGGAAAHRGGPGQRGAGGGAAGQRGRQPQRPERAGHDTPPAGGGAQPAAGEPALGAWE